MSRAVLRFFVGFLFLGSAVASHADRLYVNNQSVDWVNMRSGPDPSYRVIGEIPNATPLTVVSVNDDWVQVESPGHGKGWMYRPLLRVVKPNECALIVASRKTLEAVRSYIEHNIDDRRYLSVYKSANGVFAISIGELNTSNEKTIMDKWRDNGRIPSGSFCSYGRNLVERVKLEPARKSVTRANVKAKAVTKKTPRTIHPANRYSNEARRTRLRAGWRNRSGKNIYTKENWTAWDTRVRSKTYPQGFEYNIIRNAAYLERLLIQTANREYTFSVPRHAFGNDISLPWDMRFTLKPYKRRYPEMNLCTAYVFESELHQGDGRELFDNNGYWCVFDNGVLQIAFAPVHTTKKPVAVHSYLAAKENLDSLSLDDVAFYDIGGEVLVMGEAIFERYAARIDAEDRAKRSQNQGTYTLTDLAHDLLDGVEAVLSEGAYIADEVIANGVISLENYLTENPEAVRSALFGAAITTAYQRISKPKLTSIERSEITLYRENKHQILSAVNAALDGLEEDLVRQQEVTKNFASAADDLRDIQDSCGKQLRQDFQNLSQKSEAIEHLYSDNIRKGARLVNALESEPVGVLYSALGGAIAAGSSSPLASIKQDIDVSNSDLEILRDLEKRFDQFISFRTNSGMRSASDKFRVQKEATSSTYNRCLK